MSTATCPRPRSRGRNICTDSLAVLSGRRVPPLKRRENPRGVREDRVRLGKRRAICYGHTHVKHDDRYRFQAFLRQPGCGKTGKSIRMTPSHPCHVPFLREMRRSRPISWRLPRGAHAQTINIAAIRWRRQGYCFQQRKRESSKERKRNTRERTSKPRLCTEESEKTSHDLYCMESCLIYFISLNF